MCPWKDSGDPTSITKFDNFLINVFTLKHAKQKLFGRKYLMFVDIRKVGYLVDKLRFNFILFIYYIFLHFFIQLINLFLC